MKLIKVCLVLGCAILVLTGCGETKKMDSQGQSESAIETAAISWGDPSWDFDLSNEVHVQAEIIKPENITNEVIQYRISRCQFDIESIKKKMFMDTEEDKWEENHYDNGITDAFYNGEFLLPFSGKKMPVEGAIHESLYFYTKEWLKCGCYLPGIGTQNGMLSTDELTGELPFESKENALEKVQNYIQDNLGIKVKCIGEYTIDHSVFERQYLEQMEIEKEMGPDQKDPSTNQEITWSEEDDCYYFLFEQIIGDIPFITDKYSGNGETYFIGVPIEAAYTVDGLVSLNVMSNYKTEETARATLAAPEVILDAIKEKFDLLIADSIKINELKLIYYPKGNEDTFYECAPAWRVTYEVNGKSKIVIVDAITGDEIS